MRKRVISVLFALFCAAMTLALPVTAAVPGANEGNSNLSLHFYDRGQRRALSDGYFYLYKVGDYVSGPINGIYDFKVTKDFENAKVDLNGLDFRTGVDNLTGIINALVPYTELNKETVTPTGEGSTDSDGNLTFTHLVPGLYLVWGETLGVKESDESDEAMEWTYIPQAFLIPLPYPVPGGSFDHEVKVEVKYERFPPPFAQVIDITVKKRWEPEGKSHPNSVTVLLLRDGRVIDGEDWEVTLNADNDWTYTWTGLEQNHRWEVAEIDVPDGYTVSVDRDGYHFIITNKSTKPDDPDSPPPPSEDDPPSDDPGSKPSGDPGDPTLSGNSTAPRVRPVLRDTPNATGESRLPQTGQLWWPIPLLIAVGVTLLVIGAVLFVRKEEPGECEKSNE